MSEAYTKYLINKHGLSWLTFDDQTLSDKLGNYIYQSTGTTFVEGYGDKGYALRFDGVDDRVNGYEAYVIPIGKKSIRFKIKVDQKPTGADADTNDVYIIMSTADLGTPDTGTVIYVNKDGGITVNENRGVAGSPSLSYSTDINICDGQWHDFLYTWDGTTNEGGVKIYLDDMTNPYYVGKANYIQEGTTPANYLRVGARYYGRYQRFLKGQLDEIEIYSEVIDPVVNKSLIVSENTNTISRNKNELMRLTFDDLTCNDYVNGYYGNMNGVTFTKGDGKGYFLNFDGNDYITFNDPIIPLGKKSIRFKIKADGIPSQAMTVMSNADGNGINTGDMVLISHNSGSIRWMCRSETTLGNDNFIEIEGNVNICDGIWHDILLVWDGTTNEDAMKMYIDDMTNPDVVGTAPREQLKDIRHNLVIGYRSSGNDLYFAGQLDDIRVYNRAIDPKTEYNTDSILILPYSPENITEEEFIEYGMDKPLELDMSQVYTKKKYLVNESEVLGNGKVFKKTIDVSKVPIKSVEIED